MVNYWENECNLYKDVDETKYKTSNFKLNPAMKNLQILKHI